MNRLKERNSSKIIVENMNTTPLIMGFKSWQKINKGKN